MNPGVKMTKKVPRCADCGEPFYDHRVIAVLGKRLSDDPEFSIRVEKYICSRCDAKNKKLEKVSKNAVQGLTKK